MLESVDHTCKIRGVNRRGLGVRVSDSYLQDYRVSGRGHGIRVSDSYLQD